LLVFLLLVLSQIFKGVYLELAGIFLFLPLFIFYFKKSRVKSLFIGELLKLKLFYEHQLDFQSANRLSYRNLPSLSHPSARDLDLDEISQGLNFSFSKEGSKLFNAWLVQNFSGTDFHERQRWLKETAKFPGLLRKIHMHSQYELVDFSLIQKQLQRSFLEKN